MKFIYELDDIKIEITIPVDSTFADTLEAVTSFLRACGYPIDSNDKLDLL